ncbi:MAG: methionyl-tRNA formyltransferase [Chitinophagales bacterium]|nr:methionyl-tRNA formyltransferase [Chitinophagales bacterium]
MSEKLKIVFMGTPGFAVDSLDILVREGYDIRAVVTTPDKPAGRGQKLKISEVKDYAIKNDLPVLQPDKLRDEGFIQALKDTKADLFIVVAFRMLPEVVWSMPERGTFNLHASLLPQYRGAAPINWAIMNGEKQTGVTTFFIEHKIDTGDILFNQVVDIEPEDNASSLHDKLKKVGAKVVLKTVQSIESGNISPQKQPNIEALPAPKIFKEDCLLDFNQEVVRVHNKVRGLSEYPAAFAYIDDKVIKVFHTKIIDGNSSIPGTFKTDGKTFLSVKCADKSLEILSLQIEGKRRMSIEDFLRGYRFSSNSKVKII